MDLTTDFKSFQDLVQSSLVDVTRSAGQVANQDLSFHRSASENLSRSLDRQNAHLLRLTNKLLKAATKDTPIRAPTLQEQDDIDDNWRRIVDVVDHLLEKSDSALDEFSGIIKRQSPALQDTPQGSPKPFKVGLGLTRWSRDSMQKPQLLFQVKPDNFATGSFKPLLQTKPHAIVSLAESIGDPEIGFRHPYALEIEQYSYPPSVRENRPPVPFTPPNESKAVYVDTEEGVLEMLEELKAAKEIAIDLEHHDQHSYIGIVCLMQISTREKDWIIDTLKPWRQQLQILNEVFADPAILKVFQGATMDIIWLQRDLGLYVVGLFDTYYASSALQFPAKSLKYLLQRFADFEAQKQFQLADWRVRPLPQELIDYARADTHYLLYIYDNLRNMLLTSSTPQNNLLDYVLQESRKIALQVYVNPTYDLETGRGPAGWQVLFHQRSTRFSNEQFSVFRAIHEWRDRKARLTDEGVQNIMPNRFIWQIAESMPTSPYGFSQCCRGGSNKPVMDNVIELVNVVKEAKNRAKAEPPMQDFPGQQTGDVYGTNGMPRRPRHLTWRKQETNITGVAATLQQMNADRESATATPELDYGGPIEDPVAARSATSLFWGSVVPQSAQLLPQVNTAHIALHSVLPLSASAIPPIVDERGEVMESETIGAIIPDQSTSDLAPPQSSDIFTLHDLSRSKKRKASESNLDDTPTIRTKGLNGNVVSAPASATLNMSEESNSASSPPGFVSLDSDMEAKRARKRLTKAERRALKASQAEARAAAQASMQPFDYANAASLLHPTNVEEADRGNAVKRLNPFAKALDTTTGAKRNKMGKELAGKSMTFQS